MYIVTNYGGKVILVIIMITLIESQFLARSTFETVPQRSGLLLVTINQLLVNSFHVSQFTNHYQSTAGHYPAITTKTGWPMSLCHKQTVITCCVQILTAAHLGVRLGVKSASLQQPVHRSRDVIMTVNSSIQRHRLTQTPRSEMESPVHCRDDHFIFTTFKLEVFCHGTIGKQRGRTIDCFDLETWGLWGSSIESHSLDDLWIRKG